MNRNLKSQNLIESKVIKTKSNTPREENNKS